MGDSYGDLPREELGHMSELRCALRAKFTFARQERVSRSGGLVTRRAEAQRRRRGAP